MRKLLTSLTLAIAIVLALSFQCFGMTVTFTCDANTEEDLAGYKMYKSESQGGPYTLVGEFPSGPNVEPLMVVPDLPNNKRVYFVATAFDTEGLESDYSNEVNISSNDNTPPKSPLLRIYRWLITLFSGHGGLDIINIQPDCG